ncbi:MAG: hypothetical protein J6O61_01605 [Butyrivibrio sp.]|uniref:hypothetical protein n=1 Tax=Butyrivibrio sp. TaxID=28121 RepID=UPI001B1F401E|nr:hypothetical protein [Butyrivibrio sp.]MBO6239530.1 hypothetical protein [Butyrivibrio sp.]
MKKNKIYELLISERERIISLIDSLMKCDDGYVHVIIILDGNIIPVGIFHDDYNNKNFDYDYIIWSDYQMSNSDTYYDLKSNAENEYREAVHSICRELDSIKVGRIYSAAGINGWYNNITPDRIIFSISEHGVLIPIKVRTPFDDYPNNVRTPFDKCTDMLNDERIF